MKLVIKDNLTIREIQENFSFMFPFLKIEFFTQPHKKFTGSRKEYMIEANKSIAECRTKHTAGALEITEETKVARLESELMEKYGLYSQVFRKSGNVWIETTVTDEWTLGKQNSEAESFYKDTKLNEETYNREFL